ncbi:hypothetical protein C5E51_36305 [Nocardia nova]|nr:hypothetical protein C5E51_36305 [Nocardia nova]
MVEPGRLRGTPQFGALSLRCTAQNDVGLLDLLEGTDPLMDSCQKLIKQHAASSNCRVTHTVHIVCALESWNYIECTLSVSPTP